MAGPEFKAKQADSAIEASLQDSLWSEEKEFWLAMPKSLMSPHGE